MPQIEFLAVSKPQFSYLEGGDSSNAFRNLELFPSIHCTKYDCFHLFKALDKLIPIHFSGFIWQHRSQPSRESFPQIHYVLTQFCSYCFLCLTVILLKGKISIHTLGSSLNDTSSKNSFPMPDLKSPALPLWNHTLFGLP